MSLLKKLFWPALFLFVIAAWYLYRRPAQNPGDHAPDFTATTMSGSAVELSQFKGRYVLLHFWGSWCGPCRQENTDLRQIYERFAAGNFDIISVAIDKSPEATKAAIMQDGLTWPTHIYEPRDFGGMVSSLYGIRSIPTTYLLNPDGVIMGINLKPEQIDKMLENALVLQK